MSQLQKYAFTVSGKSKHFGDMSVSELKQLHELIDKKAEEEQQRVIKDTITKVAGMRPDQKMQVVNGIIDSERSPEFALGVVTSATTKLTGQAAVRRARSVSDTK